MSVRAWQRVEQTFKTFLECLLLGQSGRFSTSRNMAGSGVRPAIGISKAKYLLTQLDTDRQEYRLHKLNQFSTRIKLAGHSAFEDSSKTYG